MNLHLAWKRTCWTLLLACCADAGAAGAVAVTLAPGRAAPGRSDAVTLTVTVTNTGTTPQALLRWRLPFDAIEAPLFDVTRDGKPVRYLGMRVKRAAPADADYLVLAPGASRSASVELSALYDMSVSGAYTVRYRTGSPDLFGQPGARAQAGGLASEPASIWIDDRSARGTLPPAPPPPQGGAGLAFQRCSNAQQEAIGAAAAAALAMSTDAGAYLSRAAPAARYARWFGAADAARAATLTAHFAAIKDAFETRPVTVDCGCNKPYYAYVYPAQPYVIHVCKAFWPAPPTGTDSKGGTLVHEMSHFDVVAATNDWVYGQAGASALASSDPARAIDNADSHEYFGENSPELPAR